MSIQNELETKIRRFRKGKPFSSKRFIEPGKSRASVDQALSRLVKKGTIKRIRSGIYIKPEMNKYVGEVSPNAHEVIRMVAKKNGETIQIHGAEAARLLKLSTQMPVKPTYLTSGRSRSFKVGELEIVLKHACQKKLQFAQQKEGLALSALWYLGKENVSQEIVSKIQAQLSAQEFENLQNAEIPAWMSAALNAHQGQQNHV